MNKKALLLSIFPSLLTIAASAPADVMEGNAQSPAIPALSGPALIPAPVTITDSNQDEYIGVLPTWRKVTPVGTIVSTPNFPTQVLAAGTHVVVLVNGATPFQTVTWYGLNLRRETRIAAFSKVAPHKAVAFPLGGSSALAVDPQHAGIGGTVYTTDQTPAQRVKEVEATAKAEANPHAIPTTVINHADLFQGLAAGPDGVIYATGGNSDQVYALSLDDGKAVVKHRYALQWQPFPATQYPYVYQGNNEKKPYHFYPDSVVLGPQAQHLYVTGMLSNSLARINLHTGHVDYLNIGSYPFAVSLADDGKRLVVSNWAGSGVTVVDRAQFRVLGEVPCGPQVTGQTIAAGVHPTAIAAMPNSPNIWVADANDDALVEIDTKALKALRVIDDAPYTNAPPGSYPDALAVEKNKLYVANAGNDDVAVYNIVTGKRLGLIPTAWYPSALSIQHDNLYIVASKGLGTGPNLQWQYIGNMMHGVLQKVPLSKVPAHLQEWTNEALKNNGFLTSQRQQLADQNHQTEKFLRRHIHYVVMILRENKTFDEDLGDYRAAGKWADPHFDLYGPRELPNLYHWAAHNTLFVNFMADGEVTAQGHQWTDGASDSDVVQRLWPEYYSNRGLIWNAGPGGTGALNPKALGSHDPFAYNSKSLGNYANPWISYPERLYLFNNFLQHQVSFEDFGENLSRARDGVISAAMYAHVDKTYPGWDRMILDNTRVHAAISWLKEHPGKKFPHFLFIWIPDDHTAGMSPCYFSPDYYVADNDHATAEFLHYLSKTPQWKQMAVFLEEDDAQSGADHINAHRTLGLAMGPWIKSGLLDSMPLSQVNIVRTIEAIFALPPMSQWDANAAVISHIWRQTPRRAAMPVLPMQVPVQINAGVCANRRLLRREAGATGNALNAQWLQKHRDLHGAAAASLLTPTQQYTPTSLLKVAGPEQLRQEWIASKGSVSYQAMQRYLQSYAKKHGNTIAAYEANEGSLP